MFNNIPHSEMQFPIPFDFDPMPSLSSIKRPLDFDLMPSLSVKRISDEAYAALSNNRNQHELNNYLGSQVVSTSLSEEDLQKISRLRERMWLASEFAKSDKGELLKAMIKGVLQRKPFMNVSYSEVKVQIANRKDLPTCEAGVTAVFLPPDLPEVVLKYCEEIQVSFGKPSNIKRFQQMQEVRAIVDKLHCSHLIIPKAMPCQGFLVEERLPINVDLKHNLDIYSSNLQLFDEVVRELTRLFSQIYIEDIISPARSFHITYEVRYDNFPLFITNHEGKEEGVVGLIDLEQVEMTPRINGLDTIARIFPLHADIIKEEAAKYNIPYSFASFMAAVEEGKKFFPSDPSK